MKQTRILVLAVIMSIFPLGTQAQGNPGAGQQKAASCAACHGADGNSMVPEWPKLAGQHPGYLEKQLRDYQSGARENAQMSPMAAPLSAEDIADLAAFYAGQRVKLGAADPELVELGERIYRAGNPASGVAACMACHGPQGEGNPAAAYPALGGQHAQYTAAQLKAFRSGDRANDPASMMRAVAAKMTDEEIQAVSSYIAGLH